jgi:hypothetical protein
MVALYETQAESQPFWPFCRTYPIRIYSISSNVPPESLRDQLARSGIDVSNSDVAIELSQLNRRALKVFQLERRKGKSEVAALVCAVWSLQKSSSKRRFPLPSQPTIQRRRTHGRKKKTSPRAHRHYL